MRCSERPDERINGSSVTAHGSSRSPGAASGPATAQHRTQGGTPLMSETEFSVNPEGGSPPKGPPPEDRPAEGVSPEAPARPAPRKPQIGDTRPAPPPPPPKAAATAAPVVPLVRPDTTAPK